MTVTKAVRFLGALLLVLPAAADVAPKPADESGWRIGLAPIDQPWKYVDTGGRGEFLYLRFNVFTPRLKTFELLPETTRFRLRFHAEGLPDHQFLETVRKDAHEASDRGVSLGYGTFIRLAALEAAWGRLPSRMGVSVALNDDGVPAVSTPTMPILLKSIPRKEASWSELVHALMAGQSREEILDLLGPALKEVYSQMPDGTWQSMLTYPNPDAPKELPAELRMTNVYLDQRGRFRVASLHGGC